MADAKPKWNSSQGPSHEWRQNDKRMSQSDLTVSITETTPLFPDELLEIIFYHFSATTIGRAHAVCQKWNQILTMLTSKTDIWFRKCTEEIPKYTLLQMCNHPLRPGYQSGVEWKDLYVRWRLFRGNRVLVAELEPVQDIAKASGIYGQGCTTSYFTDDVVYSYIQGHILAYDMHSEACMIREHSTLTTSATAIQALGISLPFNVEGKTRFEANVEKAVAILLMREHVEILVGLETKETVILSNMVMQPMCTWYDTFLIQEEVPDGPVVKAFKVGYDEETKQLSVHHIQTCRLRSLETVYAMQLTENKAFIVEDSTLSMWDIDEGEYCEICTNKDVVRGYDKAIGVMSWVGSMIAFTFSIGPSDIFLYYLNEECRKLNCVGCVDPQETAEALVLLYDGSIMMINNNQCSLLLYKRRDHNEESENRTAHPAKKAHSLREDRMQNVEPDGEWTAHKCRQATYEPVTDEANSYKRNMSKLLGIDESDTLWTKFDTGVDNYETEDSESSDSEQAEYKNDQGSSSSTHKEYVVEWWEDNVRTEDISFVHEPILSLSHKGLEGHWLFVLTDSLVAMDNTCTLTNKIRDRMLVYKWNYMQ
nr:uncharacterized protein LOC129257245 [Lytechinus pictus]